MCSRSRDFILARRGSGIAHLKDVTIFNGDLTLDQAEAAGAYGVNRTHQIGIATSATEVGLTFDKGDSLTFSPHLGIDIAKKASMNGQNLIKDLKPKDVSTTSADMVRQFLATSGSVNFAFDPNDLATWGKAVTDAKAAEKCISEIFM